MNVPLTTPPALRTRPDPPIAILAELTHRCPLRCPYCSNPRALTGASAELDTATWVRVLGEAAALGCLQVHLSGGEPLARRDLETIVAAAAKAGLYTNLITSGVPLAADRLARLVDAGLDHVQLSLQDAEPGSADRIAGLPGAFARKAAVAALVREAGLPLTLNLVVHRQNLDRLADLIALGEAFGAARIEVAHVQYYGWALANAAALMPTRDQLDRATAMVEAARVRLSGRMVIDYVVPDWHARRPKACMGGWGRRFLAVSPAGKVLPCHAAETIPDLVFETVHDRPLADIWRDSPAFERWRGTAWMPAPCAGCDRAEIDWGGCRCQAYALTGDAGATDPACALSPDRARLETMLAEALDAPRSDFLYRG